MKRNSFTLVELMIVIAVLAILAAIILFALNPINVLNKARDSKRVTDIRSIHKAISFIESWSGITDYGSSTTVYISLPDTSSTCSSYSLPILPTGYQYSCKTQANFQKTDSNGWIPINFTTSSNNKYLSTLPIDPINDSTYFYSYFPGGSYELTALLSEPNDASINDEDSLTGSFTLGTASRTWESPLSRDLGLVGHWRFDEGSGTTAFDYSGNGYNATIYGAERVTTAGDNKAMYYDSGGTDYVVTPSFSIPNTGVISLSTWSKNNLHPSKSQGILAESYQNGSSGFLWIQRDVNTNNIVCRYANGTDYSATSGTNFYENMDNQWIHITFIMDYTNKKNYYYKQGQLFKQSLSLDNPMFPSSNRARYLGSYSIGSNNTINGYFDDMRLYNRELSPQEIQQIYNQTKHKYE